MAPIGLFALCLLWFHVSEFCLAIAFMRQDLSWRCEAVHSPRGRPASLYNALVSLGAPTSPPNSQAPDTAALVSQPL